MAGKGQISRARKRQTRTPQRTPLTSRGSPMGVDCISGQKAPLRRILRNFRLRMRTPLRSLRVTFHNVTSGQNAPLGRILRNLWLPMRTPKETPKESRDLWSLPVAMVLVLLYILYYFYSEGKARELVAHTQKIFLVT